MSLLANVEFGGLVIATVYGFPLSLCCTISIARILPRAASSRWSALWLSLLIPLGLLFGAALVLTSSWAVALFLAGRVSQSLFVPLWVVVLTVLGWFHFVLIRNTQRKIDEETFRERLREADGIDERRKSYVERVREVHAEHFGRD